MTELFWIKNKNNNMSIAFHLNSKNEINVSLHKHSMEVGGDGELIGLSSFHSIKEVNVEHTSINHLVIIAMMIWAVNEEKFLNYLRYFLKVNEHPIPPEKVKIEWK